ncbi:hypothetical protein B0H10DRAFT_1968888 [Mycena sp. CBHHK59/15]|nr:hypothetical protein B0H10DRAFT_1968888 [Mycena sp. CBHHK59/15]
MYKQRGATTDLATAICVLREGAGYKSGPPVERLFAAKSMVLHRNEHHHESALEAYKTAIDLMPKIAALSLNIQAPISQLLNREWDKTVQVVQANLLPTLGLWTFSTLDTSSHALIFGHSSNAKCVPLCPDITQEYIQWLARSLQALLSSGASLNSFFAASSEERSHFNICDRRLLAKREGEEDVDPENGSGSCWNIMGECCESILTFLRIEKLDDHRFWWCPTGSFSFLPIHAAGIYDEKAMGESASDYVISSYTPTVQHCFNLDLNHSLKLILFGLRWLFSQRLQDTLLYPKQQ